MKPAQRIRQSDVVERRGPQVPSQEIDIPIELFGELIGVLRELDDRGVFGPVPDRREVEAQRGHLLAEVIVQVAGDPAALVFLDRHQPLQQPPHPPFVGPALAILPLELVGPLEHPLFELVVRLLERVLVLLALGEVPRDLDESGHRAVRVEQRKHRPARVETGSVLAHVPAVIARKAALARDLQLLFGHALLPVLLGEDERHVLADRFVFRVPEGAGCSARPAIEVTVLVEGQNGVLRDAVDHQAQPVVAEP